MSIFGIFRVLAGTYKLIVSTISDPFSGDLDFLNLDKYHKSNQSIGNIGQLSFKKEPAGKLRVFAMVDCLTQSAMKPLHDILSIIFKKNFQMMGLKNQELSYETTT